MRAARCQHGRPRAGAGVHDPRPAGAGQVGPRVVASLATLDAASPQPAPRPAGRFPLSGRWRERGASCKRGGRAASGCAARVSCPREFLLRVKGLLWSLPHTRLPHTRLLLENLPSVLFLLVAAGGVHWLRFCVRITAPLLSEANQWLKGLGRPKDVAPPPPRPRVDRPVILVRNPRAWPQVHRVTCTALPQTKLVFHL